MTAVPCRIYLDDVYIPPTAAQDLTAELNGPHAVHAWGARIGEAHLTALSLLLELSATPLQAYNLAGIVATEVMMWLPFPGQVQVVALPGARPGWETTQTLSRPAEGPPELRIESQVICNWLGSTPPTANAEPGRLYLDEVNGDVSLPPTAGRTMAAQALAGPMDLTVVDPGHIYLDDVYIPPAAAPMGLTRAVHAWGAREVEGHRTALSLLQALSLTPMQADSLHWVLANEVLGQLPWPGQVQVVALPSARPGWEATQTLSLPAEGPPTLRIESQVIYNWGRLTKAINECLRLNRLYHQRSGPATS